MMSLLTPLGYESTGAIRRLNLQQRKIRFGRGKANDIKWDNKEVSTSYYDQCRCLLLIYGLTRDGLRHQYGDW